MNKETVSMDIVFYLCNYKGPCGMHHLLVGVGRCILELWQRKLMDVRSISPIQPMGEEKPVPCLKSSRPFIYSFSNCIQLILIF